MTSSHHGPYVQATHVLQWWTQTVAKPVRGSQSEKIYLSTDKSLQLDFLKLESLVIADQQAAVNTFPGLVHTAVTPWESFAPEVPEPTRKRGRAPRSER